jgi:hypothetical protein
MRTCAVITANLGGFDPELEWAPQIPPPGWTLERRQFNDANFPPRAKAMTSRLQPGILKMFGWQVLPGFDAYIWVDTSRTVTDPGFCAWMIESLGDADLALFRHPLRKTVAQEARYMLDKMADPRRRSSRYLLSRYEGEWIEKQLAAIQADTAYKDEILYASTALIYRPTARVQHAFTEWWHHKTRYLLHDQLALPYVVWKHGCRVNVIEEDIYTTTRWAYTRPRGI